MQTNPLNQPTKKQSNLVGQKFGRLTVLSIALDKVSAIGRTYPMVRCLCDCGCTVERQINNLQSGLTKSCGCLRKEKSSQLNLKHGQSVGYKQSKTFVVWRHMIDRCSNPKSKCFKNYGQRGITVCERWSELLNFVEDMGEVPPCKTLDRIKNDLGYFKENCRWATRTEQARNKRSNLVLTVRGITGCLVELCERFGVSQDRTWSRLHRGWSIDDAFFKEIQVNQFDKD